MLKGARPRGTALEGAAAVVDAAYQRSGAARWQLTAEAFASAVAEAVDRRFGDGSTDPRAVETFVAGLHAEDLALACACAEGRAEAWDHFVITYRPELYRAARAIAGEAGARELADSLYAELFGLPGAGGTRRSLLTYYHGRSRLTTWLRSVLAQRHVDTIRATRRQVSLDDPDAGAPEPSSAPAADPDVPERMRTAATCVSQALEALDAESRLRLAYYYVHGLTLAETGRLFGEHEATASRKLEKARRALRTGIAAALARHGLGTGDVESWSDVARQAWDAALGEALGVAAPAGAGAQAGAGPPFKRERTP